uniref:Uncharacterized protein n=1 Tax=Arion vulgaris TaxID=1028688 RepID=A0A0B7AG27_9EUPU
METPMAVGHKCRYSVEISLVTSSLRMEKSLVNKEMRIERMLGSMIFNKKLVRRFRGRSPNG